MGDAGPQVGGDDHRVIRGQIGDVLDGENRHPPRRPRAATTTLVMGDGLDELVILAGQPADLGEETHVLLAAPYQGHVGQVRTRCIGSGYDPAHADDFYLEAGPLREAVDYLFHFSNVTPARFLARD